jgi:predicted permease
MTNSLRYAFRSLRRAPVFTITAILTLAIGAGANVAVFTVVNAVLLRPLPVGEPERLAMLSESHPETGQLRVGVLPGSLLDWRERSHSFEAMSLVWTGPFLVTNRHEPARVTAATVSSNFFDVISARPLIGRTFPAAEAETAGHEREIVISHALWQQWFGGDPSVLGRTLEVQGRVPLTIVGVMPAEFRFPRGAEFWRFEIWQREFGRGEADRWRQAVGRLKPGVSLDAAERELQQISGQLASEFVDTNAGWTANVESLSEAIAGPVRKPLEILLAAVILVHAIACINVAALILQRDLSRRRELATRIALGARVTRLVRQSVLEHAVVALAGLAAGGALAFLLLKQLLWLAPPEIPRFGALAVDWRLAACLAVIGLATVALTGALPVLRSSRVDAASVLRTTSSSRATARGWRGLVVVEVMLAVVLLAAAGLMTRTLLKLQRVDIGFTPAGVTGVDVMLPMSRVLPAGSGRPAWDRLVNFYGGLVESVGTMPGVERVALVAAPELGGRDAAWSARTGIVPPRQDGSLAWRAIQRRAVSPAYFDTVRLPLLRGRPFSAQDTALEFLRTGKGRRTGVAIVNAAAARQFWGGGDPIGQSLTIAGDSRVNGRVVVAVAGDARDVSPDQAPRPTIYVPFAESPDLAATLLIRTPDAGPAPANLRSRLRAADALLMIGESHPLAQTYAATVAPRRFTALVLGVFAVCGLALAGVGLYGLLAASAIQRLREFAIRIALGATPRRIWFVMLAEAALIVGAGVAAGAMAASAGTRLLRSQLFEVESLDPATWAATLAILIGIGFAAAWAPARRASQGDPAPQLRLD